MVNFSEAVDLIQWKTRNRSGVRLEVGARLESRDLLRTHWSVQVKLTANNETRIKQVAMSFLKGLNDLQVMSLIIDRLQEDGVTVNVVERGASGTHTSGGVVRSLPSHSLPQEDA